MFIIVTRHTGEYCGEDQPFDISFSNFQDIDTPYVSDLPATSALRSVLRKYFSDETTNKFIEMLKSEDQAKIDSTYLVREKLNGKDRYSLIVEVEDFTIECGDDPLRFTSYPIVLAELFEM